MNMNKKELEAFAKEAAKGIETPEDLNEFSQMRKKITVGAALNAEMNEHLGYEKIKNPRHRTVVTVRAVSALESKMVSLNLIRLHWLMKS